MPRPEKVQAVADIKERIEAAQAVFVTEFRGLTVTQLQKLRASLRETGAEYKVVKMSLARRAADELSIDGIDEHLMGPTALAFANVDPVATAKALRDVGDGNEKFVIKAGILSGEVLLPEQVRKLASIESRDVLLAKIAGAAKAPLYKGAAMFASFTRNAATMMSQLLEKKESGEPTPSGGAPAEAAPAEPAAAAEEE
jgi:large subunit ribosomal protein L10